MAQLHVLEPMSQLEALHSKRTPNIPEATETGLRGQILKTLLLKSFSPKIWAPLKAAAPRGPLQQPEVRRPPYLLKAGCPLLGDQTLLPMCCFECFPPCSAPSYTPPEPSSLFPAPYCD